MNDLCDSCSLAECFPEKCVYENRSVKVCCNVSVSNFFILSAHHIEVQLSKVGHWTDIVWTLVARTHLMLEVLIPVQLFSEMFTKCVDGIDTRCRTWVNAALICLFRWSVLSSPLVVGFFKV